MKLATMQTVVAAAVVSVCAGCGPSVSSGGTSAPEVSADGVPFSTNDAFNLPLCASGLHAVSPSDARKDPSLLTAQEGRVLATTLPQMTNRNQIGPEMVRQYPRELATRGIGGTAVYRLLISADGGVSHAALAQTSGHHALDTGARTVVLRMRFTPATYQECRLPFVVEMPVEFFTR